MGAGTLAARANSQLIDETWFNAFRDALNGDQFPRNSSGVATDQGGSLGSSSLRFLNAYLLNLYLMSGSKSTIFTRSSGGSDHTIAFPNALPGSTVQMKMQASGIILFEALAKADMPALGQQISSSCGAFSHTGDNTVTDITNLSVTLTTTGRPIFIGMISDGNGTNPASIEGFNASASTGVFPKFYFYRGLSGVFTEIARYNLANVQWFGSSNTHIAVDAPSSSLWTIDIPSAGTYTYKAAAQCATIAAGEQVNVYYSKLVAFEFN